MTEGWAIVHETDHRGTHWRDFASSASMDREAAENHLAYCQMMMQEDGRRGADGRYFLVRWEEVETDD